MAVTQCLESAAKAQLAFKNKNRKARLDKICPCDQHCFASTMTTDLSAFSNVVKNAMSTHFIYFLDVPKTMTYCEE